jgi:hypothetical protein
VAHLIDSDRGPGAALQLPHPVDSGDHRQRNRGVLDRGLRSLVIGGLHQTQLASEAAVMIDGTM